METLTEYKIVSQFPRWSSEFSASHIPGLAPLGDFHPPEATLPSITSHPQAPQRHKKG